MSDPNDWAGLTLDAAAVLREFADSDLGDKRRDARLRDVVTRLSAAPDRSILAAMRVPSAAEGAYRLLRSEDVTMAKVVAPHIAAAAARASAAGRTIIVHDTTDHTVNGGALRPGLGWRHYESSQGFFIHASLAVSADSLRTPFGVVALSTWVRTGVGRKKRNGGKALGADYAKITKKESNRWLEHIDLVHERMQPGTEAVHVADREGCIYPLMAHLCQAGSHFVIRMTRHRTARADAESLPENVTVIAARGEHVVNFDVPVLARKKHPIPSRNALHPPRDARTAHVAVRVTTVELCRPRYLQNEPESLEVNLVRATELDPPKGEKPIDWLLVTTEPVDTVNEVLEVIDIYRTRWLIEEYFKALKTGCGIEKRELESRHTLENVLGICIPLAYQMLLLRNLARNSPMGPASAALTETQLDVLSHETKFPRDGTLRQALIAVAELGGYYNRSRPPGWLVLARGMQHLLNLERGVLIARKLAGTSDQT